MKTTINITLLASLLLLSGCALVSKQNTVQGNTRTFRYGLLGGWIPLYSSTETIEK
jgi:hypothetical protein